MESSYLPFHVAIASVFGLYFLYWYKVFIVFKKKPLKHLLVEYVHHIEISGPFGKRYLHSR